MTDHFSKKSSFVILLIAILIAIPLIVIVLQVIGIVVSIIGLSLSSVLGSLSLLTHFIEQYYFSTQFLTTEGLNLIPEISYIIGFTLGASLLSIYTYFTQFYASQENLEIENPSYSASIFTGAVIMVFGRLTNFYWSGATVGLIQSAILDTLNIFPILLIILFFKVSLEGEKEVGLKEVITGSVDNVDQKIAKENPFVKFFLKLLLNPTYVIVALLIIILTGYSTFFIERNLHQFIELKWVQIVSVLIFGSYIYSAIKGKKSIES